MNVKVLQLSPIFAAMLVTATLLVLVCNEINEAQTVVSNVSVEWQRYSVSETNASILFPHMPVKMSYSETCSQKDTSEYYSYENDVVYQLTIIKKSKTIPIFCPQPIKFNKDIYDQRILKWTQESVSKSSISVKIGNMTALEFALAYRKIWVFNDMSHDRWIEIVINPREAAIFDTSKFLNSIDLDRKNNGIDIGDGAIEMLGDGSVTPVLVISETPNLSQSATEIKKVATDGLRIVAKPKPAYTDQARKKLEQGHVLLRVAFLANGRIGSISVING